MSDLLHNDKGDLAALNKKLDWLDYKNYIELETPKEFSFKECLVYLGRSDLECLHKIWSEEVYKLLEIEDSFILIKIGYSGKRIRVTLLNKVPSKDIKEQIVQYIHQLFDLETELSVFYNCFNDDKILGPLIEKYYGLRIIKIPDLFEGLCWAVIGQQINLKFAYTLKDRLVRKYGEKLSYDGDEYWTFPKPESLANIETMDLKDLQFTTRKAEYIIGLAKLFVNGELNIDILRNEAYETLLNKFVSIRGVGKWTADYTIMKCFNINCAFPIADVGIHNALKSILKLDRKPSITEIEKLAADWQGWESYAAFYLWRTLYD